MNPCPFCGAAVAAVEAMDLHRRWHVANDLHHPECAKAMRDAAQANTDMYLAPQPCSCGLVPPPIERRAT